MKSAILIFYTVLYCSIMILMKEHFNIAFDPINLGLGWAMGSALIMFRKEEEED